MSHREQIVLLAGGRGSRIQRGDSPPKPLTVIGDKPIIGHIIDGFARQDFTDFIVALGHFKSEMRHYFSDWQSASRVMTVDTGENTDTGGRILRLRSMLADERFILSYSDAVWDVDMADLLRFHKAHNRIATVVAVEPRLPYGLLTLKDDQVASMVEKPLLEGVWVSAGIFVVEPDVFGYLTDDAVSWERHTLPLLAERNELTVYRHGGFWQSMDTMKDAEMLNDIWMGGDAPWLQIPKSGRG